LSPRSLTAAFRNSGVDAAGYKSLTRPLRRASLAQGETRANRQ
jgi:hypothetical protein